MGKTLMIGVAWVATVAIAWMIGGGGSADEDTRRLTNDRSAPAADKRTEVADREDDAPARDIAKSPAAKVTDDETPDADAPPPEDDTPFTVEGVESIEELSARFMKYAAKKLAEGPEGHKELFKTMDAMLQNRELRPLVRDERQMMPLAYPWLRFAMDREKQIVAMMETLYKTAAENPGWYAGLDDDPLQLFTEGLAVLLPGYASPEQLERFRGHVKAILEHNPESLPKALQKNMRDFARNLDYWQPQLSPEEALKVVQDPSAPPAQRLAMLSRVDKSDLRGVELAPILAPSLRAGDGQALRMLRRLPITPSDIPALDVAFMEGVANGRVQGWTVNQYLHGTQRSKWDQAKAFYDQGLARGGKTMQAFAQSLIWPPSQPPKEYIRSVLEAYDVGKQVRDQLKQRYSIE